MNPITHTRPRRLGALAFATALALAACGSDDAAAPDTDPPADEPATEMDEGEMDEGEMAMDDGAMTEMDMADMNMGDPNATPAADVEDAALASGEFALLDTRPAGYDDVAGTATIARHANGTTVTTEVTGLLANTTYISHVHESPCSDSGGDHFQFVDGTVEVPPNEIHLMFTSDADGAGSMTAENTAVATDDAVAFVVHPLEFIDNKVACVDFVANDPDAIAEAIATGPTFDASSIEGMEGMNMNNMDMSAMSEMDDMNMDDDAMGEMDMDDG